MVESQEWLNYLCQYDAATLIKMSVTRFMVPGVILGLGTEPQYHLVQEFGSGNVRMNVKYCSTVIFIMRYIIFLLMYYIHLVCQLFCLDRNFSRN